MKYFQNILCAFVFGILLACADHEQTPLLEVIDTSLHQASVSAKAMGKELMGNDRLPRTIDKEGKLVTSDYEWWCSGFYPGVLWYLYENSKDTVLLQYAREYTARLEKVQYITTNHDVGFMLYCSYGNGLRITGDNSYKSVLLNGAKSLSTRYKQNIGLIRSWDFNKERWQYPVIIDNMMNLELLTWASRETDSVYYKDIAINHADKTLQNHFRDDYSCYHVVSYDTITGTPHCKETWQGLNDESSWARGQAWALYGYTYMFRETKNVKYLDQAIKISNYLLSHPNMPDDGIPYWDFDAEDIPNALRDASAAAIICSALIELSDYVGLSYGKKLLSFVEKQIRTLSSGEYLAEPGTNGNFILKHSVGFYNQNSEVDVPLTYADYYYVEALMRMKKKLLN